MARLKACPDTKRTSPQAVESTVAWYQQRSPRVVLDFIDEL
jgi:hypothetical protein